MARIGPRAGAACGVPLYRNGYALVASSARDVRARARLLARRGARLLAAAVGVSAALISAMTLLANLAQLNLKGALNRFLPAAGARRRGSWPAPT